MTLLEILFKTSGGKVIEKVTKTPLSDEPENNTTDLSLFRSLEPIATLLF